MDAIKRLLGTVCPDTKLIDRLMRRLENPDIPEDVWRGTEDAEEQRLVEMETALRDRPPER